MSRYTAFTDNTVFLNKSFNLIGNIFFDTAVVEFPTKTISSLMCVTGKTSRIAQDEATGDVQNLAIITSDDDIFNHFSKNVKSIFNPDTAVKLKDTLQFTKFGFNFELHRDTSAALTIVTQDGLYLHQTSKIPAHIL